MSARQGLLPVAGFCGFVATLVFYLLLFFVQIQNADNAWESYPQTVPDAGFDNVRSIGFENSYPNLGGRCRYGMDDGSVMVTREPGWWFPGTIAGFAAALAGVVIFLVRRKGHPGLLFGLTTLLAPPLGLLLGIATPRRASSQKPVAL